MNLRADLEEFVYDHRSHGPLTGDPTEPAWNDYLIIVACPCRVVSERWVSRKRRTWTCSGSRPELSLPGEDALRAPRRPRRSLHSLGGRLSSHSLHRTGWSRHRTNLAQQGRDIPVQPFAGGLSTSVLRNGTAMYAIAAPTGSRNAH